MEIQKILPKLGEFKLRTVSEASMPAYIETHKMIKPKQTSFFSACLYVGYVSELPDRLETDEISNLICIEDVPLPPDFINSGDMNLFLVPIEMNQFDILNKIADILIDEATLVSAMHRILNVLYSNSGLQELVNIATEVFENPIFINDSAFKILAMSQNSRFFNKTLEEEKSLGYVHEENVKRMRQIRVIEKFRSSDQVISASPEDSDENWLFKSVKLNGITVADIAMVDNNRPFNELDKELLDRFSIIVSIEMQKNELYKGNKGVMYSYFIADLLSEKLKSPKSIEKRTQIIGWKLYEWFQIMVVVDGEDRYSESKIQSVADRMRDIIPDCRWTIYQQNIVVFISRSDKKILTESEAANFDSFLLSYKLYAGISEPFNDLSNASYFYKQATRAVDVGSFCKKEYTKFFYTDMIPYFAAKLILKRNELSDFRTAEISKILEYDAENHSELMLTLEKYLYYVDDPTSAAKSLNIHRNTLLYRINKIKELTNIDIFNGDERFKLQLYFKLSEFNNGLWNEK